MSFVNKPELSVLKYIGHCDSAFLASLFILYVRPTLEYASQVWCPHLKLDIGHIERVQRSFTKRMPALLGLSYDERLRALGIESLEHRRIYLDLVFFYKIVHGLLA